jgi:hypothetical protein
MEEINVNEWFYAGWVNSDSGETRRSGGHLGFFTHRKADVNRNENWEHDQVITVGHWIRKPDMIAINPAYCGCRTHE